MCWPVGNTRNYESLTAPNARADALCHFATFPPHDAMKAQRTTNMTCNHQSFPIISSLHMNAASRNFVLNLSLLNLAKLAYRRISSGNLGHHHGYNCRGM